MGFNKSYHFELETLAYDAGNRLVTPQLKVNLTTPATLAAGNAIVAMLHDKTAASAGTDFYFNVPFVQGKMFAGRHDPAIEEYGAQDHALGYGADARLPRQRKQRAGQQWSRAFQRGVRQTAARGLAVYEISNEQQSPS
ncbi:hypothetical protein FC91_GL000718 [Schleiferilactobacillus harbinensis DSM 16991]|uniref:Uncharacterized protein n=1 Tax=Schleiferilactobacillus harbinensis DSM 16991 TaxID=1122147 RepID=A0A0R1XI94_9LACO|nr:hypothetical protein FC91_GL000718 [Schleiferilactobacillus harbinensis DSM 16991]